MYIDEDYNGLFGGLEKIEVASDLTFPNTIEDIKLTYNSEDIKLITNEGKITRGLEDEVVKVNITLEYDNLKVNKVLEVTILKDDNLYINNVYENLFNNLDLNNVTTDLDFKTSVEGVNISYESLNPNVVSNTGEVTRRAFDEEVVIKIKLTLNSIILSKEIKVTVLKDNNLFVNHIFNLLYEDINLNKLDKNLDLITNLDGVEIAYESQNPNVINNNGVINRGEEDKQAKFVVTLTYEDVIITKELLVTVLKQENIAFPILSAINAKVNQTVTVQGIVIGKVGNSYFINDDNDGIYLYFLGNSYNLGDEIRVTGVKTVFNGLHELKDFTEIDLIRSGVNLPNPIEIQSVNDIIAQSSLYDISNLEIIKFDSIMSGKDNFITAKDSNNKTIEIIISKHTDANSLTAIQNKLKDARVGDKIHLTNAVSTYFNKYQIQLFSANQLILETSTGGIVTNPIKPYYPKSEDMRFIKDELDEFLTSGLNPLGDANVFIIPVNFTDYTISATDLERLELAFFGTSQDTGWESVKTYYDKSSFGKFNFNGDILSPFQTNKPSTYYASKFNQGFDADYEIIKAALEYYDDQIDYSLYDNDNDGYIDGLYFIYATPVWYGEHTGSANDSDLWWAYVYQYYTEDYELYDGVEANYYLWAGIDFMDEAFTYDDYTDEYISINASTYIHETGHMLGLDDYYDYEEEFGPGGGLGGADMMDYTVGDHNSFSKIMLNWVTPLVVSGKSTTVTIESFSTSGDVILVSTNWNNSYFDEYFLIELYTPTGLNAAHAGFNGLYDTVGIRIFHVNAELNPDQTNGYLFLNDNSYTETKLLKPLEADGNNSIENYGIAENSDLFQAGTVFGKSTNYRLSNGLVVNFDINIVSIVDNSATIEIIWENN